MKVLIACEESQEICKAFRRLGHDAYSADRKKCTGGHPEWHLQGDVIEILYDKWDLVIANPPCTFLTSAGANRLFGPDHEIKDEVREELGWQAKDFFMEFINAPCPRVCIENPTPMTYFGLPMYDQVIHPYMFGDPWKKRTCLWLKGLPQLRETYRVVPKGSWTEKTRIGTMRSKTFPGIAQAMADQWGRFE